MDCFGYTVFSRPERSSLLILLRLKRLSLTTDYHYYWQAFRVYPNVPTIPFLRQSRHQYFLEANCKRNSKVRQHACCPLSICLFRYPLKRLSCPFWKWRKNTRPHVAYSNRFRTSTRKLDAIASPTEYAKCFLNFSLQSSRTTISYMSNNEIHKKTKK